MTAASGAPDEWLDVVGLGPSGDQAYAHWEGHLHPDDRERVVTALNAHLARLGRAV